MLLWQWPLLWLAVGAVAAVIEGLTVQLVSIWFALSAGITALVTLVFRPAFSIQLLVFSLLGLVLLVATRSFVRKKMQVRKERTNADRAIGETGIVTKTVGDAYIAGRVLVNGMDWAAKTQDGVSLEPGARVTVKAIQGVTLLVEKAP